jgi:glycosyltransferase involved in cell wall biosynthesis
MKKGKLPLISIALATYNGERFLRQQLDSIYAQTYPRFEVIASDDASTDGTVSILKEYKNTHGLKFTVNKKNSGFVKNFENALKGCSGEFIALSDQDDVWHPDKLEVLLREIGGHSIICSDAELIDGNGAMIATSFERFSRKYDETDDQFKFFVFRNYVTGCTSLISRDVITRSLPIPEGVRYHDWWFAIVAATRGGVRYLPVPLLQYRQHGENDTGAGKSSTILRKFREYRSNMQRGIFDREIRNLEAMLSTDTFTAYQRSVLRDRLTFYTDRKSSLIHWKSCRIAIKYRKYMLAGRGPVYKAIFFLASLI